MLATLIYIVGASLALAIAAAIDNARGVKP